MHLLLLLLLVVPVGVDEGITWEYEGLDGLDRAVAAAKKSQDYVMVGLSGSDR